MRSALQIIEEIKAGRPIGALDFDGSGSSVDLKYGDSAGEDYKGEGSGFQPDHQAED